MNIKQNKNKKLLSSLLCALLCSSNSSVSSMIVRPNLADEYNDRNEDIDVDDDDGYGKVPWENIDTTTLLKSLGFIMALLAVNKKLGFLESSIADDISSGFQRLFYSGYGPVGKLADDLDLSSAEVGEAVTFGGNELVKGNDSKWADAIGKLAQDLHDHDGWVSDTDNLSTYWKLTVCVKTDLNVEFGTNMGAVLKKLISNRSHLGSPLVVDKNKTLNNYVKPFTEDGGFKSDGLKINRTIYPYTGDIREFFVCADKKRSSLFSVNSAMLQTYHLFYKQKKWDPRLVVGQHETVDFAPKPIEDYTPSENDIKYGEKGNNKNSWAFKIGKYVYVRVPTKWGQLDFGAKDALPLPPLTNFWGGGNNGKGLNIGDIPVFRNGDVGFLASLDNRKEDLGRGGPEVSLKNWLSNSNDKDSSQATSRYIAIPI